MNRTNQQRPGRILLAAAMLAAVLVMAAPPEKAAASHNAVFEPYIIRYENHVHTSTSDDPPAIEKTRVVRVPGFWYASNGIHFNPWRRNSDGRYSETSCYATVDQILSGHFNCNPSHSLYGHTWLGPGYPHRDELTWQQAFEDRVEKYTVPVNHLHPVWGMRCTTDCAEHPGTTTPGSPSTTIPPVPGTTRPPITAPPGTTSPPSVGDGVTVTVDSFRQGQTGGSLTAEQVIKVTGSGLTCNGGQPAPCGPAPGSTISGTYGPIPVSLRANLDLTAPAGFTRGSDPSRHDYQVTTPFPSNANLWAGQARQGQRFFTPTPNNAKYRINVTATANVRYISWGCDEDCSKPEHHWQSSTDSTVGVTVIYRPNADGRFAVVGANVQN